MTSIPMLVLIFRHMPSTKLSVSRYQDPKGDDLFEFEKPKFGELKRSWHRQTNTVSRFPFDEEVISCLLEPNSVCLEEEILLLVVVHSSPYHVSRRQLIRKTWGNTSSLANHGKIKILFLFGTLKNAHLQEVIKNEHRTHGDILQGRFSDSYFNLSFNTMTGLEWIKNNCQNSKVVVKVDDDIVIDMRTFIDKVALKLAEKPKQVFCKYGETKIFRSKASKHYVSEDYFEGRDTFPGHCEGKLVAMTSDIVPLMHMTALNTPFFFIEDVYFYGVVLNRIQGINITQMKWNKDFQLQSSRAKGCLMKKRKCTFFIAGADSDTDVEQLWSLFRQRNI